MNKQTVYILIGVAAVAGIGYYLYKRNQRNQIVNPTPATIGAGTVGGNEGFVDNLQDAWDSIFGKS